MQRGKQSFNFFSWNTFRNILYTEKHQEWISTCMKPEKKFCELVDTQKKILKEPQIIPTKAEP